MAARSVELLARVPLFSSLSKRHLKNVAELTKEERFAEKETIAEEGQPGDDFYVLVEGEARVVRRGRTINRLMPGDFFGEIALLDEGPRTATIIAETPVSLLSLNRKPFHAVLRREPAIVLKMLETLAVRVRNQERSLTG